eukprot:403350690
MKDYEKMLLDKNTQIQQLEHQQKKLKKKNGQAEEEIQRMSSLVNESDRLMFVIQQENEQLKKQLEKLKRDYKEIAQRLIGGTIGNTSNNNQHSLDSHRSVSDQTFGTLDQELESLQKAAQRAHLREQDIINRYRDEILKSQEIYKQQETKLRDENKDQQKVIEAQTLKITELQNKKVKKDAKIVGLEQKLQNLEVKLQELGNCQKRLSEENKELSEELFIAKGGKKFQDGDVDLQQLYFRLGNILTALKSLSKGQQFDLDILTEIVNNSSTNQPQQLKMIHFNKVLTQVNGILCEVYAKMYSQKVDCFVQ